MTFLRIPALFAAVALQANAQAVGETPHDEEAPAPKWDVFTPEPLPNDEVPAPEKPAPISTHVISSNTVQRQVTEPPPMDGVPPVTGKVNVTLEVVEAPKFPKPRPLPPSLPTDPAVQAQLEELSQTHRDAKLVFVSASVYDNHRTLLQIYPNGGTEGSVTAWSNLDFNLFTGCSSYCVTNRDGSIQDICLLMGIGDIQTAEAGGQNEPPTIPALPDLAGNGPAFLAIAGDENRPAMDVLEQMHDLFQKEGAQMAQVHAALKQAEAERKAELLAHPAKPADVTIRYWKGNASRTEVAK